MIAACAGVDARRRQVHELPTDAFVLLRHGEELPTTFEDDDASIAVVRVLDDHHLALPQAVQAVDAYPRLCLLNVYIFFLTFGY